MTDAAETTAQKIKSLNKRLQQLERAHLQLRKQLYELEALHGVLLSLSDDLDMSKTLSRFQDFLLSRFTDTRIAVMLTEESGSQLRVVLSDWNSTEISEDTTFDCNDNLFGKVFQTGEPLYIPDVAKTNLSLFTTKENGSASLLCLPLTSQAANLVGILGLARDGIDAFAPSDQVLFAKIAKSLASVVAKNLLFQRTKELSITDSLTQLYNRRHFRERLEQEVERTKRYHHSLTLLMIDIDHFKKFNDIHGHLAGDKILKQIADLLERNTRQADIVARFGGEEFVILLPEIRSEYGRMAAEKLRCTVENTSFHGQENLPGGKLTISVGFATFPQDSRDARDLLDLADRALYLSKKAGRNRVSHISDGS